MKKKTKKDHESHVGVVALEDGRPVYASPRT
jgi:hypothetical protein